MADKNQNSLAYYLTHSEALRATLCTIRNSRDASEEEEFLAMLGLSRRKARGIIDSRKESGAFGNPDSASTGTGRVSVYPLLGSSK